MLVVRAHLRRCLPVAAATRQARGLPGGTIASTPASSSPGSAVAAAWRRSFSEATADGKAKAYSSRHPKRFETVVLPLLRAFIAREGHCDVPSPYRVDRELVEMAGLHEQEVGFSLGRCLNLVQGQRHYLLDKKTRKSRIAAMRAVGFDPTDETRWQRVLAALRWYKAKTGTADVVRKTILYAPQLKQAGLPPHLEPYRLGKLMNNIRNRGDYVLHKRVAAGAVAAGQLISKNQNKKERAMAELPLPDFDARARELYTELGVSVQQPAPKNSQFRGVALSSKSGGKVTRWRAKGPAPKSEYLGVFATEEKAALKYDAYLIEMGLEPVNFDPATGRPFPQDWKGGLETSIEAITR